MGDDGAVGAEIDRRLVEEAELVARTHAIRRRLGERRESMRWARRPSEDGPNSQLALGFDDASTVSRGDGPAR